MKESYAGLSCSTLEGDEKCSQDSRKAEELGSDSIFLEGIDRIHVYMTTWWIRFSSVMPRAPTDVINL